MAALTPYRVRVRPAPIARLVRVSGLPKVVPGDLAGVALALSLSAGALSVVASLAAATAAASQANGDIGVGRPMMAATSASAAAAGDLTVIRGLAASTQAVALAAGTLQVAGGISGASSAASQASGELTVQRGLAAATFAPATSSGTLAATVSPTADTAAPSTSAGDLTVARLLSASTPALATSSATLTLAKGLDGAGASTSTATGNLTVARPIAASTSALSSTMAALTVVNGLNAATLALSAASGTISSAPQEDADAASYLNAQTTPPSATERSLVDALVKGLKADGDWAGFDWILLLAAESAQAARLNLRNPAKSATAVNAPTFTANLGYLGDGTASYIDMGEAWAATGNQFVLNSAVIGVWCNATTASGIKPQFGNTANAARSQVLARSSAGNENFRLNDSADDTFMASNGSRLGHRAASRIGAASKRGYFNGSLVANLTTASSSVNTANGCLLRSLTSYADDRLSLAYSGAGLSDAAMARIHNRFNTYLSAKGAA